MIDLLCGSKMVSRQRAKVVPAAEGRVLEVGFGSGTNLPFYDPGKVERLFALEPDTNMVALARRRLEASALKDVEILGPEFGAGDRQVEDLAHADPDGAAGAV